MAARKQKITVATDVADDHVLLKLPLVEFGTAAEREAGWAIVKEALAGGWRSVGPYGPRADLYDRP